jgi:hypothetical protein
MPLKQIHGGAYFLQNIDDCNLVFSDGDDFHVQSAAR